MLCMIRYTFNVCHELLILCSIVYWRDSESVIYFLNEKKKMVLKEKINQFRIVGIAPAQGIL